MVEGRAKEDSERVRQAASRLSVDAAARSSLSDEEANALLSDEEQGVPSPVEEEFLSSDEETLPRLARAAVETYVRQSRLLDAPRAHASSVLGRRAACFVCIKTSRKELRGCIGTIEPAKQTLAEELIANAVSAATRDPRFRPVTEDELHCLCYSVDVLYPPEPARFEDLDPARFGVIVEDDAGARRGLLLPDIEGIETAAQQVEIAARKAGIAPGAPLRFFRFCVRRFRETARFDPHTEQGENR